MAPTWLYAKNYNKKDIFQALQLFLPVRHNIYAYAASMQL